MSKSEENYSVTDLELLAIVKGLKFYRHYLLGKNFTLRTDHRALTYIQSSQNSTGRLLRWSLQLPEYDFSVEYMKGEHNAADVLSRIAVIKEQQEPSEPEKREI